MDIKDPWPRVAGGLEERRQLIGAIDEELAAPRLLVLQQVPGLVHEDESLPRPRSPDYQERPSTEADRAAAEQWLSSDGAGSPAPSSA